MGGGGQARATEPGQTPPRARSRPPPPPLALAADLARRSEILLAVAPKLRSKPATKIVELLLAEDCLSPAEAARQARMTDRAARRLFDRLPFLGARRAL